MNENWEFSDMDTIIQSTFIIAAVSAFESSELLLLSSVAEMDNFTVIIDEPTTTTTTTITTTMDTDLDGCWK